jgi:putative two-component system response regulator
MNTTSGREKEILSLLISLCDDLARGRTRDRAVTEQQLYTLTSEAAAPKELARLAEAFGLMLVKLDAEVMRRTSEIQAIQDVTILMMASLAETRDNETGNHIRRTQRYIQVLAQSLREHPRFQDYLNKATIDMLHKSAPLHDIGKVGIPDHILMKPGRLTPEDFEIMKNHTILGQKSIAQAEKQLGKEVGFLGCAKEIAYAHHEKWDGSGYPNGLAGDDIPISARLMALADVYDALICRRIYKPPMSHEKAKEIIVEGAGKHFDADVVQAFLAVENEFTTIAARFGDNNADSKEGA